jgi:2-methylcitrate dehydratase PrpD
VSAAFLNAAGANVHDFCDTHLRTVIHPSAPVAPALLALAELRRGPDLLLAFILGDEIQARIGLAISPNHYSMGWHITSTCGVFGAAGRCDLGTRQERRCFQAGFAGRAPDLS